MSEFTQVKVRRGKEGLGRSKGFWSGKEVLFNIDKSTIYVLDEKTTTKNLIDAIKEVIDTNLRDWVVWDVQRNFRRVQQGKVATPFFSLHNIPSLKHNKYLNGNSISLSRMVRCWKNDNKTSDQLCEFLADELVAAWNNGTDLYPNCWYSVPSKINLAKLLLVHWDRLDNSIPLEAFLQNFWNLSEMDMSGRRFLGPGETVRKIYITKENYGKLRYGLREDELNLLAKCGFGKYLEEKMNIAKVRAILSAPKLAALFILVNAKKNLLLPPHNLGGDPGARIIELGWINPFEQWFPNGEKRTNFAPLLVNSNIREVRDIPADIRNQWGGFSDKLPLKCIRNMLLEYGEKNKLPPFNISPLESNISNRIDIEMKKWSLQWFRDQGHPEAWCNFADAAYKSSNSGFSTITIKLKSFCEWAIDRFKSPWDITSLDLQNPHNPNDPDTFAAFCKKRIDCSGRGGRDPYSRWSTAASLFKLVRNFVSIPGYPWYRENAVNPFELINTPFKFKNYNGQKTHRSRISTLIHEKMIETILDIDEEGKPTFSWAKTQFTRDDTDARGVWCPSRWTALAILLLLPLRKKQVRWLDQGLMDETIFNPETFQLTENTHTLRSYTYEDGKTHQQRYGRSSGVIQQMTDDFMGISEHIGLFINTNKTQLWNPEKRSGYELPWPDGSELIMSQDDELRQHGAWLRRVYEVLAYQYRFMNEYDPSPEPVSYLDVRSDALKVSFDKDCAGNLPRFVPLFRDTSDKKQLERYDTWCVTAIPVSERKIEFSYTLLCLEVEARLKAEGFGSVSLTLPNLSKSAPESGIKSRVTKFDVHCLRVAGISRLIESGIDPTIVQEFVAAHLTPAMTHRYIKMQPWHVREKIIEAIVNGDFKSAMDTFAEKVAKGEWDREKTFVGLPRFQEHVANLPEDFACFSAVKGGICVMGGKGDACNEGGVYERQSDGNDTVEYDFGPVQGGCGNCIHFRTAAFLIQEQSLVMNILLAELRAQARERKKLRTKISDLTCKIDEAEGSSERHKLISDKNLHESRIEELNHDMVPKLTEWVNRYIMLKECEGQLDELMKGNTGKTTLVAPFGENIGLTADDLKVDQEYTSDIGLIGRVVEGSRNLGTRGIAVPEDSARFLECGVDKLLRMIGSPYLMLDIPAGERVHGVSMMYNALEDLLGAETIQNALDCETPLALPEAIRDNVNQFAEALIGAAKKGRLTIDNLLNEGRSCKLITDIKEGDARWAM